MKGNVGQAPLRQETLVPRNCAHDIVGLVVKHVGDHTENSLTLLGARLVYEDAELFHGTPYPLYEKAGG